MPCGLIYGNDQLSSHVEFHQDSTEGATIQFDRLGEVENAILLTSILGSVEYVKRLTHASNAPIVQTENESFDKILKIRPRCLAGKGTNLFFQVQLTKMRWSGKDSAISSASG